MSEGDGERGAVWVQSDTAPDGTYVCAVHFAEDISIILNRKAATRYAMTVVTACAMAEYDAAVFRQLTAVKGLTEHDVVAVILEMRRDRAPLDDGFTYPLRFVPILGARTRQPLIHAFLKGEEPLTEWTPAEARGHVMHVLDALVVADLDGVYRRHLVGFIGLDDARARAVVDGLKAYREPVEREPEND